MPEKHAADIIKGHWKDGGLPVDPIRIAVSLSVPVLAYPGCEDFGKYEPVGATGTRPLITYNPFEKHLRSRFTIAHLLGHHVLGHIGTGEEVPLNFNPETKDTREANASLFAICLLIPELALRAMVEVENVRSLRLLSQMFYVSTAAMGYRLRNLGYDIS